MKVYVIMENDSEPYEYSYDRIFAIYTSREEAEKNKPEDKSEDKDSYGLTYSIEEHIVQGV